MPTPTSPEQPAKPSVTPAEAIAAIGRGTYKPQDLHALSDLSRADARELARAWPSIPEATRVSVLRELDQVSEADVRYLFGRVFRIALDDPSPVARQLAIDGLWEDQSSDLIDVLLQIMENDSSIDVRAEAAAALAKYADLAAAEELDPENAANIRQRLLQTAEAADQSELVRRRALESVAVFGDDEGIQELIRDAFDSDDVLTRASAIYAMGRTLDRRWLSTVIGEFESSDAEVRYEAARACGELGHVDALSGLSDLVQDQDTEVRQAVIGALGKIGGPGAVRVLRAYSESCPPADRELVDEALSEALLLNDALRAQP